MSVEMKPKMSARDALEAVPDDVSDEAALVIAAQMAGMDYDAFIEELSRDADSCHAEGNTK